MCATCGCSGDAATISREDADHTHVLPDGTVITHRHESPPAGEVARAASRPPSRGAHGASAEVPQLIELQRRVLHDNDQLAARNRAFFHGRRVAAINLMSSPGAGKTTLLERTLRRLRTNAAVLEGDQETENDAKRIRATGVPVVQINTGEGCHLDAEMVWRGVAELDLEEQSLLFVENVGNLVCPALFDLGEAARVVLFSVTEGEDKPLKYPHMFRRANLVLLTKTDLLPHLAFDTKAALAAVRRVQPEANVLCLSTTSGEGMDSWMAWLEERRTGMMRPIANTSPSSPRT